MKDWMPNRGDRVHVLDRAGNVIATRRVRAVRLTEPARVYLHRAEHGYVLDEHGRWCSDLVPGLVLEPARS